jgi:hypothetical protein
MTITEICLLTALFVAACAIPIWAISLALHYIVALKSPPRMRAIWTVLPAYIATIGFMEFGGSPEMALYGPFAALPATAVMFWVWHRDFRRAWVDDAADLPDGVALANDDWRVGLAIVVAFIAVAVARKLPVILALH